MAGSSCMAYYCAVAACTCRSLGASNALFNAIPSLPPCVPLQVSHVVGSTVESVQDLKGRAEEAKSVAHSAVSAAADTTKQFGQQLGQRAVQALETDEIRDVKEAKLQREGVRRKPWWQFMRNGGGLE